jgi:hypothetical protein
MERVLREVAYQANRIYDCRRDWVKETCNVGFWFDVSSCSRLLSLEISVYGKPFFKVSSIFLGPSGYVSAKVDMFHIEVASSDERKSAYDFFLDLAVRFPEIVGYIKQETGIDVIVGSEEE